MKSRNVPLACIALPALLFFVPARSGAQLSSPPPTDFQILQTSTVNLGNRAAIFNFVAPPNPPIASLPAATPPPLTPDQISALALQALKKKVMLLLSVTVYDRQVAQVRWWDENGFHQAFSNIDFNYFGVAGFGTTDTNYFLSMGLGNDTRAAAAANNIQVPPSSQFSTTRSQYLVVQDGSNPPTAESLKGMDDLHTYFDANKQQLIDSYNQREADRIASEQWLKDHPPGPQDTVINFWPVKSTNYQTAEEGGRP